MVTGLIGHYYGVIDAKNRSFIPAPFREALSAENAHSIIISASPSDRLRELYFFFPSQWQLIKHDPRLFFNRLGLDAQDYDEEYFFGNCFELFLDEQGRILFPQVHLKAAEFGKNIVFIGVNDHGIIRDRDEYEAQISAKLLARRLKHQKH